MAYRYLPHIFSDFPMRPLSDRQRLEIVTFGMSCSVIEAVENHGMPRPGPWKPQYPGQGKPSHRKLAEAIRGAMARRLWNSRGAA